MTDDLIARLRSMYSHRGDGIPTQYVNPDGPEAADEIERLNATLEKVRRSALTITEAQRQIYDHYQSSSKINREAVGTLDSERECNALLTAEVETLRDALRRQTENVAWMLNRVTLADQWYCKFSRELEEDRNHLRAQEGSAGGEGV